jgi:hypothetical protein
MEPSASPAEAAAITAAVERFIDETTPEAPAAETVNPWTRAALLEGVGAKRTIQDLEGGMR